MNGYLSSVFIVSMISGLFGYLSFGKLRSAERVVMGVILLYVIIAPLSDLVSDFDPNDIFSSINSSDVQYDEELSMVAEEAFAEGIKLALAEEFSISRDDIRVKVFGFDLEGMSGEKIKVSLSGKAALADYRAIESFLNKQNIGECEVEIEIG